MKKIFQVVVEGENPDNVFDVISKIKRCQTEEVKIDSIELERKIRYTNEDDFQFCIGFDVRIPKEVSVEFLSAFKVMIAYWDKVKESEDGRYWTYHHAPTVLKDSISRLDEIVAFMNRAKGLGFEGTLETKIYTSPFRYPHGDIGIITEEEAIERLLDKHKLFLDWKPVTANTQF